MCAFALGHHKCRQAPSLQPFDFSHDYVLHSSAEGDASSDQVSVGLAVRRAVALEESAALYSVLVARGRRRGQEAWRVSTAAADGLAAIFGRAQVHSCGGFSNMCWNWTYRRESVAD